MSNFTNKEFIQNSKKELLENEFYTDEIKQLYEEKIEEELRIKLDLEAKRVLENISEKNPQIKEFIQEFYSLKNNDLESLSPNIINENNKKYSGKYLVKLIDNEKGNSDIILKNYYDKYDEIFINKNLNKSEISNEVCNKFNEFNKIFHSDLKLNEIKNSIENDLQNNLKDTISFRINMATDTDKLKSNNEIDKFAKFLNCGREFKGNDNIALFQTLKMMDKALMDENNRDFKMIYEKIGLEFTDINGKKVQINAKLGEGWFQKDLNHLINLGSNDCSVGKVSGVANKMFIDATELVNEPNKINKKDTKGFNFKFKNQVPQNAFDKIISGGVNAIALIAESTGDESMQQFAQNFTRVANLIKSKDKFPKTQDKTNSISNQVLSAMGKDYKNLVDSGQIKVLKEKEKEITMPKDIGMGI